MEGQMRRIEIKPQKKAFFSSDKGPAASISVGKLKIGNPILQDNAGQNPLNKIATMDLEEAARLERERRAKMRIEPLFQRLCLEVEPRLNRKVQAMDAPWECCAKLGSIL